MDAAFHLKEIDLIPQLGQKSLLRNAERRSIDYAEASPSVVMFADLAGFSALGARLVAASDRGAEELRDLINIVFEQVAGVISAYGGSILYYAGDAIAAAWPHDGSDLVTQAERATACGIAAQAACDKLSAVPGAEPFEMSVALAEGEVWIVHLATSPGGPQLAFCGDVLEAFGGLASQGDRTGVLIAPALFAELMPKLEGRATFERGRSGTRIVSINTAANANSDGQDAVGATDFAPYVQSSVRTQLNQMSTRWVAEFRSAHILFARFGGFSFGDAGDLARFSALATGALGAVDSNGGALIQLVRDDKGLVLLAGWGLATSAFENAAERAVSAARSVAEVAQTLGLKAKVAVTAGKVFAGLVGAPPLFQYVMVGEAVNRAAGMSVHASDPVTIDEATRDDIGRRYDSVAVGALRLKGRDEPVPVYLPTGETLTGAMHKGAFLGRVEERERLEDLLGQLRKGVRTNVHIFGDPGLGKSRLAGWFEQRLHAEGVPCLRMNADSLRRTTGYIPWKQVLSPLLGLSAGADSEACEAAVLALLGSDEQALPLLPLLSPVLPAAIAETAFTATLVGAGRAESARGVMLKLLSAALGRTQSAGTARVLVVEDAHWLDSASWQLLEAAERQFPELALLIVSRPLDPQDLPTETRRLFEKGAAETIDLVPLSRQDAANLICQALDVVEAAPEIVDVVYREAEGHPLFTTALVHSLHQRGLIRVEGGYAHLRLGEAGLSQLTFPDGIEGVIIERISSLSPARQLIVKVASVLGRYFNVDALTAIHPDPPGAGGLAAELDAIAATGLIDRAETSGRFRFHHALIGDAAYRLLVTEQRRSLHEAAGRRIEERTAAGSGTPDQPALAMLAHHFERAGETRKALDYLARAAEAARIGYNNVEVIDFLSRALMIAERQADAGPDALTLGEWKYTIAEALRALGRYQRAEEFLRQSAAILDRPPPTTGRQATGALLAGYARFRFRRHRAAQPQEVRRPLLTAAAANMTLSEIHYEINKIPFALSEILRGANLAREAGGDSATLSKLYIGMALIATLLPWALDGDDLQRQSLAIADRLGDPATSSWVYMVSGVYETGKGGWAAGDEYLNRSRQIGELCGERKNWETAMSCLGNLKRLEGRFAEAKGWSDLTLQASRERGIVQGIVWSHNGRARDLLSMSDFAAVREEVAALDSLLRDPAKKLDANDNNNLVYLYASIFCDLEAGDDAAALATLETLMDVLTRIKRPQVYMVQNVDYYSDIVWNLWKRGHRSPKLLAHQATIAKSGRQVARQYRTGLPMAELAAGDGAWYRGKPEQAAKHWSASAKAAKARGMRYNAAHALFRLDEAGIAGNDAPALEWQPLVTDLNIRRPALWSLN